MMLKLKYLSPLALAFLGSAFFTSAYASDFNPAACTAPTVDKTLMRPLYLEQKQAGRFNYKFEFRRPKDITKPVVIYLPGGPGEGSIGKLETMPHVPEEFGLILTDPRGVGCNQIPSPVKDSFYGTIVFATDLVAMIQKLGLRNYILYGHSYGTVLATQTAALIESLPMPAPRAVVLEGVMGKPVYTMQEYVVPKLNVWKKVKSQLSPQYAAALARKNPLGFEPQVWGLFLAGMISEAGDRMVLPLLQGLNPANKEAHTQLVQILESMKGMSFDLPPMERLWKNVACRELMESSPGFAMDFFLQNGELVPYNQDVCGQIPLNKAQAFDAAKFQIKAPVFYFVGELDIATTEDQGAYHYNSQKHPAKYFFKVLRAGHKPLSVSLGDCATNIFRSIGQGNINSLRQSIGTCTNPMQIKAH